jgi:hypothetical protein
MDRREAAGADSMVWSGNVFSDMACPSLVASGAVADRRARAKLDNVVDEIVNQVVEFSNA